MLLPYITMNLKLAHRCHRCEYLQAIRNYMVFAACLLWLQYWLWPIPGFLLTIYCWGRFWMDWRVAFHTHATRKPDQMHAHTHIHTHKTCLHAVRHTHTHTYTYTHLHAHAQAHTHIHTLTLTRTRTHTHTWAELAVAAAGVRVAGQGYPTSCMCCHGTVRCSQCDV